MHIEVRPASLLELSRACGLMSSRLAEELTQFEAVASRVVASADSLAHVAQPVRTSATHVAEAIGQSLHILAVGLVDCANGYSAVDAGLLPGPTGRHVLRVQLDATPATLSSSR